MRRVASQLRIHEPGRHIFLCCDQTLAKCCTKEAGMESWNYLKGRIKVSIRMTCCFGLCHLYYYHVDECLMPWMGKLPSGLQWAYKWALVREHENQILN